MKFRFCGGQDCPDWLLAEIVILTKITSVKMKLLAAHVTKDMLGEPLNYEKVSKFTADAKLDTSDVKATIACLLFIIGSAAKHSCDEGALSDELQQLGLPKEHAVAISKAFGGNVVALQAVLKAQVFRLWTLEDLEWRVDYILSSSKLVDVDAPCVQLKLKVKSPEKSTADSVYFEATAERLQLLLSELKQAEAVMTSYVTANP